MGERLQGVNRLIAVKLPEPKARVQRGRSDWKERRSTKISRGEAETNYRDFLYFTI